MTTTKVSPWAILLLTSCLWLLAPVPGHCFWNPGAPCVKLATAYMAGSQLVSQSEVGFSAEALGRREKKAQVNPFGFSAKCRKDQNNSVNVGYRYYNASSGRWMSRDPIEEKGGKNLFGFVENRPISRSDAVGHSSCRKCGVKSVSLTFLGIIYSYNSYGLPLVGEARLKTSKDGKQYDSSCCLVIQITRGTITYNGQRQDRTNLGLPLDGNWYIDENPWLRLDQVENAHGVSFFKTESDLTTGEVVSVRGYDEPGASGLNVGDTISDEDSFQWLIYDICGSLADPGKKYHRVAQSRVVNYWLSAASWPSFSYSYTK